VDARINLDFKSMILCLSGSRFTDPHRKERCIQDPALIKKYSCVFFFLGGGIWRGSTRTSGFKCLSIL
jgi:hypothetical protein